MNTDMATVLVDIICTVWEGIIGAYLIRIYVARKIPRKKDFLWVCFFILFVEIMTFLQVSSIMKVAIELLAFAWLAHWLYKVSLQKGILFMLLFILSAVLTEILLTTGTGFLLPDVTDSNIFWQTEYYLIYHMIMTAIAVVMRKTLKNIGEVFSRQENILLSVLFAALIFILMSVVNNSIYGKDLLTQITQAIGILILFAALFLLIYFVNNSVRVKLLQQREEQQLEKLQMQQQYYEERLKEEERVRRLYHDMKNHLLILQAQIGSLSDNRNEEQTQETKQMIECLQRELSDYEAYVQTGNAFLDIILRDKTKAAKKKHIDFHTEVDFSKGDFMEPLDVSTLFGNALDNAIEACEKLSEEERFMTLKVGTKRNFLVIYVENSAVYEKHEKNTTKDDSFLHGFGLKNMQKAVEKYGGQCKRSFENGVYMLSILIPIAEK